MLRSGVPSPNQLAAKRGCSAQSLRNWLRQEEADRGERQDVLSTQERARLRQAQASSHSGLWWILSASVGHAPDAIPAVSALLVDAREGVI